MQRQLTTLLYSVTALCPASLAQLFGQVCPVPVQLSRHITSAEQSGSLSQVFASLAHWPPVFVAVVWQVSHEPPVLPESVVVPES
jgi:hypothetical protein